MFARIFNRWILLVIVAVVMLCASNIQWGRDSWKNNIKADGKGYYAYLPAVFIYHDFNFSFFDSIEKKYPNPSIYYDYRTGEPGKEVNKYFAGTALAMLPFFATANTIAMITDAEHDGYSKIYLIAIGIAALFYLFLGLYYLKKLLLRFGFTQSVISAVLIAVVLATNIFYYAVCEPAMSHIYSFAFVTMFVYYLGEFFTQRTVRIYFVLCVLLGIIILIRPVNGLVVLIAPFVAGNKKTLVEGLDYFKKYLVRSVAGVLLTVAIVSIQAVIYKIQTGSFWVDSYSSESFNWLNPHPLDFLFSYKKGVFVYTPLVVVSLLGFYYLFIADTFRFISLLVFAVVVVYVLSSWWSWWYGGSFASRVSIEYYFVPALLIGYAYQLLQSKWKRGVYTVFILAALILCQLQTYQYRYYNIHWEKMDKEHYWRVFLRMDKIKENPNSDLLQ